MKEKKAALFILIFVILLLAGCGGGAVTVTETPAPTETPAAAAPVPAEIPPAAAVLELPDFGIAGLVPDAASGTDSAGNFCIADETSAADQDCEDPSPGESFDPGALMADVSGMNEELLPDYRMPDLDGTEVRLGDMIHGNQITMVNVWGITCGPCMTEMPELVEIRRKFGPRGLEVVGLAADLLDGSGKIDPSLVAEAKDVVKTLGVDYPILAMTKEVRERMGIFATPTTYLLDSSGAVIGEAVMGTRSAGEWERIITDALQSAS